MQLNIDEEVRKHIQLPCLDQFPYTPQEKIQLLALISKLKVNQANTLVYELQSVLSEFDVLNRQLAIQLAKLAILDWPLSLDQLKGIFSLNLINREDDEQLAKETTTLLTTDIPQDYHTLVYNFRHIFFLDKLDTQTRLTIQRNSERYLNTAVSKMEEDHRNRATTHSVGSAALLANFDPAELVKHSLFKQIAKLTIYEIQAIIASTVQTFFGIKPFDVARITTAYNNENNFSSIPTIDDLKKSLSSTATLPVNYYTGENLLMRAVRIQAPHTVSLLLSLVDMTPNHRSTALHYAVTAESEDIVSMLIDSTTQVDATDEKSCTALFRAAEAGNSKHVIALLQKGAHLNFSILYNAKTNVRKDILFTLLSRPYCNTSTRPINADLLGDYNIYQNPTFKKIIYFLNARSLSNENHNLLLLLPLDLFKLIIQNLFIIREDVCNQMIDHLVAVIHHRIALTPEERKKGQWIEYKEESKKVQFKFTEYRDNIGTSILSKRKTSSREELSLEPEVGTLSLK